MPRLVNKPPAYSLHKPSGLAKVKYRGRVTYLGRYGTPESKALYARFIGDLPKADEQTRVSEPAPGTMILVAELVSLFFDHASRFYVDPDGAPTGHHITIRSVLRPLDDTFGHLPAPEFGPKNLKRLQEVMARQPNWCRDTVNRATNIIKQCFKWGASEEFFPAGVALALTTVTAIKEGQHKAREKPPIGPVADEIVDATLPRVPGLVADVIRVMRLSGARPTEVLRVTAAEIDRSDPECWVYRPRRHKNSHRRKSRVIFFGPRAQEILLPYIVKAEGNSRLFPLRRDSLHTAIIRGCKRAFPHPTISEIQPKQRTDAQKLELAIWQKAHQWHPNQLRHSAATQIRKEFGLEAAQVVLGHAKADMTQRYAERDMQKGQDVARKIG
jgi:integrase